MIVDFRKSTVPPPPPSVMDSPITSVESFRFLGTTINQDLKWEPTISSLIKKAQQRMYFLRQLRKAKLPAQMLVQFYTAIIESILTSSITVWFAGATVRDKQRLQRIVRSAEEVIGRSLPSLQDLLHQRALSTQRQSEKALPCLAWWRGKRRSEEAPDPGKSTVTLTTRSGRVNPCRAWAELDRKQETVPDSRGTQRQGGSLPCV
uniref:Alkylated DNA repair protein AlkB homologue 8 N-terminal domain-containing protein n=1 Tax=Knipowitschia caucasica TaxID=637954 RepID=A0AAV2JCV2_KNICA